LASASSGTPHAEQEETAKERLLATEQFRRREQKGQENFSRPSKLLALSTKNQEKMGDPYLAFEMWETTYSAQLQPDVDPQLMQR
jgi:hypothetical protein